ncbi:hypothetical protein [Tsuneonella amylolytica]|uniref:hypothetical protein n=1 Tax=Tsuneonella amylolytica TaxID=2338327 RepID=UPI000EA843ED|nr:hypothetical protein [Tsuneonella amylolytica]
MKAVFAWLARTGFLYVLLCAAIAFFVFAWPAMKDGLAPDRLREDAMGAGELRAALAADYDAARAALARQSQALETQSLAAIDGRIAAARASRGAIDRELAGGGGWLDAVRPSRILARKRLELRGNALNAEIGLLQEARNLAAARDAQTRYPRVPTARSIAAATRTCAMWTARLERFESDNAIRREYRAIVLDERDTLQAGKARECGKRDRWTATRDAALAANRALASARERYDAFTADALENLPDPSANIDNRTVRDIAWMAFVALLGILLAPFAIRTLFYFALAPMVERGRPIRLSGPSATGAVPRAGGGSRPTLSLALGEDEEILVRQGYLQSTPDDATTDHRWVLSWRHLLSSIASGMVFLTRGSGAGKTFGISARDDPFAEIARIDLPDGAALVLQPRALAAIVQPAGSPMPIRSRWRFGTLHAWLTFQFRYLVFHGPGTLVVKGGRGVRVERAESGRRFAQDQLIGFSAETAYSVARSETFPPYLFGREPLFRDRVSDADGGAHGILVLEEAPMAGRRKGVRGGLEGAFDAALKAFGI